MTTIVLPEVTQLNVTLPRANTLTLQPTLKKWVDGTATVINLTGATIAYKIAKHADAVDLVSLSVGSGITVIDAATGRADIALTAANTTLQSGDYYHDCTVVVGGETITCFQGTVTITRRL